MSTITQKQILSLLSQVQIPGLHRDIVTLNMVQNVTLEENKLSFTVVLPPAVADKQSQLEADIMAALRPLPDIDDVSVRFDKKPAAAPNAMSQLDVGIRHTIAVASGKGGVGKSTTSTNLAISLALDGAKVGLLDADVYGPNVPIMMGVHERPKGQGDKIIPPEAYGVKLMSMGFLVNPNDAVIWRGPMVHNALRQFLQDVNWGDLDYLVVDLPPGTGDVSLSLTQSLSITGAVIVTTPQRVALSDVVRGVSMFKQLNVPILGVVENMSYFEAPDTGQRYDIFGTGGGSSMAAEVGADFLGEIPLEPQVRIGGDEGQPIVVRDPASGAAQAIRAIAQKVTEAIEGQNSASSSGPTLSIVS